MHDDPPRPDPDALLRQVQRTEARAGKGKLKVFFGFAPGVGKTYRMLQVARDRVIEQGCDVVVGLVETHRRHDTAAMALGLDMLPRRSVVHRGCAMEEFDLDAALARRPGLILVDELAHTNAPGSRHPKRWQDVAELLDAGIDVFTTMNVQHVESLNDVVAQITQVRVRETVPDAVLDAADAIELVDIAPEELLQRLREGKVYLPDQARRAADHFFQRGNLLALRELALRRTAQHVDEDVLAWRTEHGVSTPWPAGERIVVCVGPSPSSGRLLRAAARLSAGLRCPWVAAYVETTTSTGLREADHARLEGHLRLAESLGGTVVRLTGRTVAEPLLAYARQHNVTRIVIGKPTHSRLRDRLWGSLLDDVVRGSGAMEVQVMAGDGDGETARSPARRPGPALGRYLLALAVLAVTVALAALCERWFQPPDVSMLFLLGVMATATWAGRGPAMVSAVLGVAAYDFGFVAPRYTFRVTDSRYILTFAMMVGVGWVMSELTTRLRRQERFARGREERTAVLYALTRALASADETTAIGALVARHAHAVFAAPAVVLLESPTGTLVPTGSDPERTTLDASALGVARWCHEHGTVAGVGTDTLPGAAVFCAPLRAGGLGLGVLVLVLSSSEGLGAESRDFLDVFLRQVAAAMERARLAGEARAAELRAKTEEMRASLLSAVSHDLRTPLASITGAAMVLRDDHGVADHTRAELLDGIVDQAERLERLVGNLLDMTRLEAGGLSLRREWVPLEEMVSSALTRLESRLGDRPVRVQIAADLPLLSVDPVLFEQVFINLLENAARYTPPEAPVEIVGRRDAAGSVVVEVMDQGEGIDPDEAERVFEKFYRGRHAGVSGAGLGLSICRGIVEAHGGTIAVFPAVPKGARFRVTLPPGEAPPPEPPPDGADP